MESTKKEIRRRKSRNYLLWAKKLIVSGTPVGFAA